MTDNKKQKQRKLSHEIVGLLAISFVIALFLLQLLSMCAVVVSERFLSARDIVLTQAQLENLDIWVFNLSLLVSVLFFLVLFLFLLGERLSYIRELTKGIDALQDGQLDYSVPLEGRNELTQLARDINYLSATQREIKEKERALNEEKE